MILSYINVDVEYACTSYNVIGELVGRDDLALSPQILNGGTTVHNVSQSRYRA
jgi:hypothetical protein